MQRHHAQEQRRIALHAGQPEQGRARYRQQHGQHPLGGKGPVGDHAHEQRGGDGGQALGRIGQPDQAVEVQRLAHVGPERHRPGPEHEVLPEHEQPQPRHERHARPPLGTGQAVRVPPPCVGSFAAAGERLTSGGRPAPPAVAAGADIATPHQVPGDAHRHHHDQQALPGGLGEARVEPMLEP